MKTISSFSLFLNKLGYSNVDISSLSYSYIKESDYEQDGHKLPSLDFYFLNELNDFNNEFYKLHKQKWNESISPIFIIISQNKTFIVNSRIKPSEENPKIGVIHNFDYGISSPGFSEDELNELRKESIDNGTFWKFVIEHRKKVRENEVDKDLLLNLIYLKNKLFEESNKENKDIIMHLVILRCLFIKYLEDRKFLENELLINILRSKNPQLLIEAFENLNHFFNGDIFEPQELTADDINLNMLNLLDRFFTSDFKTGQDRLFPYSFDLIPITLISNVYEAFLKNDHKQTEGIFYTPTHVVRFILAHTLRKKLKTNKRPKVVDLACGSGAFLVESLKMIIESNQDCTSFEEKKKLLTDCIFGIDLDKKAIQISSFSLYLALLENQDPDEIKKSLKKKHKILPMLKNTNLIGGINSLLEPTLLDSFTFDCIVGNPPWGGMPNTSEAEKKDKILFKKKFGNKVGDYQRSQAFLLEFEKWADKDTIVGVIVNNSNFYNMEKAFNFRKEFLSKYKINYFYELSGINRILFKKQTIGDEKTGKITLGANEPAAIIIFDKNKITDFSEHEILYITPKLNPLSEYLKIIAISNYDIKKIKQEYLLMPDQDDIWRIFVNGDWDDYKLIKKKSIEGDKNVIIDCHEGFQPLKSKVHSEEPYFRRLIEPSNFTQYYLQNTLGKFDWNLKKRRDARLAFFPGDKIIFKSEPMPEDKLKLRAIIVSDEPVFKHNIFSVEVREGIDLKAILATLNSSFVGYYLYHTSSQWGKGKTRNTLRAEQITSIPFPNIDVNNPKYQELITMVDEITRLKREYYKNNPSVKLGSYNQVIRNLEVEIDNIILDLYRLKPFEKEIIHNHYEVNVYRKDSSVTPDDIKVYVDKFREIFYFILKEDMYLNATYHISSNIGTFICFNAVKKAMALEEVSHAEDINLLSLVKKQQLEEAIFENILKEEKIKIYDSEKFYIIKSNFFRDWSLREATKDAKEEISEVIKNLPKELIKS